MTKLICLRHPKYIGKESPVLSCKTCCGIFIGQIKEENLRAENEINFEISDEIAKEKKRRDLIRSRSEASTSEGKRQGFNPDLI